MHPVIVKTFGGLSKKYYFRHLFFGLIFFTLVLLPMLGANSKSQLFGMIIMIVMSAINTFLYPYSRFVYERVVGFFMGENVFIVNAFFLLFVKLITMIICWGFAIFIAPIGLGYLYYFHSKSQ